MRTAFFILLLANVFFWGWTQWIAVPSRTADSLVGVPRLKLVARDLPPPPPGAAAAQAPAGALGAALAAQALDAAPGTADTPQLTCVSVGPFAHDGAASSAQTLLNAQHLQLQLRTAAVHAVRWYWVYLPDVSGVVRVRQALLALHRDGINGAEPMPTADGQPGISLGLFGDRALAQRQLRRSRAKGFAAKISPRLVAQPAYWLDVWVPGGGGALPMSALRTQFGANLGTQPCPSGAAPPVPAQATGAVAPGVALPANTVNSARSP
ncbi:MAG: hypothetical protein ACP5P4_15225 [Steroidobacteraceae bacterium]